MDDKGTHSSNPGSNDYGHGNNMEVTDGYGFLDASNYMTFDAKNMVDLAHNH